MRQAGRPSCQCDVVGDCCTCACAPLPILWIEDFVPNLLSSRLRSTEETKTRDLEFAQCLRLTVQLTADQLSGFSFSFELPRPYPVSKKLSVHD
jgi:hypothetical protein